MHIIRLFIVGFVPIFIEISSLLNFLLSSKERGNSVLKEDPAFLLSAPSLSNFLVIECRVDQTVTDPMLLLEIQSLFFFVGQVIFVATFRVPK